MSQRKSNLAAELRPEWLRDIDARLGAARAVAGGQAGGLTPHALADTSIHTGTLLPSQAPWALTNSISILAGNGLIGGGVLTNDVGLSVGAGTLITVDADAVNLANGTAQYQVPVTGASPYTPAWTALSSFAGNGLSFTGGQFVVGQGAGLTVDATTVALTTPGTLSVTTTNNASGSHTHAIMSSSNPGAASSLLSSDANGFLTLVQLTGTTRVRTPLLDTAAGVSMTINPALDLILNPGSSIVRMASGAAIQASSYASRTTGWRITDLGEGDFRYLFADEMHVKSFIADLEQALAGGQIISKSVAVLATAFTAPAAGGTATLRVRDLPSAPDMACFQSGDIVRLRQFSRASGALTIADCWGTVTGYTDNADGTQTWTFTRSTAPNAGAMAAGTVIAADALVLDYGTSGNGFYEVNAIDGAYALNSPYAQIVSWSTHPATGATVRTRFGNLRGLFGVANEYGLYAGNGTGVNDAHLRMSNVTSLLQNIPLNFYESGTRYLTHSAASGVQILSGPLSGGNGYLRNNRAVTWHTALPGNASNIIGGVGVGTDGSTRNSTGLTSISYDDRTAQLDLTAGRDGVSLAFLLMEASGTSSATKINVKADRIYLNGLLYATDGTIGTPATNPIWHAGNDGSGSGLDADLLDGYHASSFALLSGATFTGALLSSGTVGYNWTELTPNNNWSNFGSPNATLGYKTFGSLVSVKGVVRAGASISPNTAISNTQLPAAARPSAGRSFACMGSIGGAKAVVRVYVDTNGYIRPQDGFSTNDWLSVEFTYFTGG